MRHTSAAGSGGGAAGVGSELAYYLQYRYCKPGKSPEPLRSSANTAGKCAQRLAPSVTQWY